MILSKFIENKISSVNFTFHITIAEMIRCWVRRNKKRMFENGLSLQPGSKLSKVSQNVIPSKATFGGVIPLAFTEQGVAIISSVLKSKKALQVIIAIMWVSVEVRWFILYNNSVLEQLKKFRERVGEHDTRLNSTHLPTGL